MQKVAVGFLLKHWKGFALAGVALLAIPVLLIGMVFSTAAQGMMDAVQQEEGVGDTHTVPVMGTCAPECAGVNGSQAGFSVKTALEVALSEVGTARATGWSAPGECVVSVRRWIHAGGGQFNSGAGVVGNYSTSGAVRVTDGSLRPGDVVQYEHRVLPQSWEWGVHTYMVLAVHADGTHDIVESNVPYGSGRVGVRTNQQLSPPVGFNTVVWRFAVEPDL